MTENEDVLLDDFTAFLRDNPKYESVLSEYIPGEDIRELEFDQTMQEKVDHMLDHMLEFARGERESYRAYFHVPDVSQASQLIHFEYTVLKHMTGLNEDHSRQSAVLELAEFGLLLHRTANTFPNGVVHGVSYVAYKPGDQIDGKFPVIVPEQVLPESSPVTELTALSIGRLTLT